MTVLARLPSGLMLRVENPLRNTVSPGYLPMSSLDLIMLQPVMYSPCPRCAHLSSAGCSFFGPGTMAATFFIHVVEE